MFPSNFSMIEGLITSPDCVARVRVGTSNYFRHFSGNYFEQRGPELLQDLRGNTFGKLITQSYK